MTKLQAIRNFVNTVAQQKVIIARNRLCNNWAMTYTTGKPRIELPSNLNYVPDDSDKAFRENFISRCPSASEFSNVTLMLLHEIGHWFTRFDFDEMEDMKQRFMVETDDEYMNLPCEYLATEWAIAWIDTEEHKPIARQFEKNFSI